MEYMYQPVVEIVAPEFPTTRRRLFLHRTRAGAEAELVGFRARFGDRLGEFVRYFVEMIEVA